MIPRSLIAGFEYSLKETYCLFFRIEEYFEKAIHNTFKKAVFSSL
jgi:hypothetical protein